LKIGYKFKDAYGDTITIDESNQGKYPYAIFYEDLTLDHLSVLDFSNADVNFDDFKYREKNFEEKDVMQSKTAPNVADTIKDNTGAIHKINLTYGDLSNNKRSFYKSNFDNANLSEATLKGNFDIASFKGANLSKANLTGASINGVNSFAGANLEDVIANGVSFVNTILKGVKSLKDAELNNANLYCVDLTGANLTRANLTNANLNGANLSDTDLTGATLTNAILNGANLSDTDLTDATLTNAIFTKKTQYSVGTKGLSDAQKWQMTLVVTFKEKLKPAKDAIATLVIQMKEARVEVDAIKDTKPDPQVVKAKGFFITASQSIDSLKTAIDIAKSSADLPKIKIEASKAQAAVNNLKTEVDAIKDDATDEKIVSSKTEVGKVKISMDAGVAEINRIK